MTENNHADVVSDILGDFGWAEGNHEYNVVEVQDDHTYILGLDPGGTTGFAIVRIDPNKPKELPQLIFLDQIPHGRYGFKEYFQDFYLSENVIVVSEQWDERNKKGVDREPQYIEGSMHMLWGDEYINYQSPTLKSLVPDEFLIEQGVWTPGKRHQMDALIHILVYLRNEGHEGTVGALGGDGEAGEGQPGGMGEPVQGDGSVMGDGFAHSLEALAQSLADERGEGQAQGGQEGEPEGPSGGAGQEFQRQKPTEVKGKRRERDLGGAFAGYVSEEDNSGAAETTLLDD